ncbi:MAG: hypothetical protein IKJ37_03200 [Kiritimatiellae bacterium]|nr:hypothetical protein [Kiritimatiellia bacterium]
MKKLFTAAVVAMLTCSAAFAQGQKIIIGKNGSRTLDPGFQVDKYQILGSKDLVGVDVNGGVARVTGLKEGTCSVKVIGTSNMEEIYEVVIGDDLIQVQRNLQTELDEVSGIEIAKVGSSLIVRGEVNDPDGWRLLKITLSHGDYRNLVKDRTKFRVQADTLKNFYQQLRNAKFELTDNPQEAKDGKLYVKYEDNMVLINGVVYSTAAVERLDQIIATQATWLRVDDGKSVTDKYDWKPICRKDVTIDHRLLHMDVVIVGYKETNAKSYGTDNRPVVSMAFNGLWDLVSGNAKNDTFQINADLNAVLDFLKKNEITRQSTGGYLRFKCNDTEPSNLKIGGTLKVKMQGESSLSGSNEHFEDIEYGFFIDKKLANLVDSGNVDVKFDVNQKTPIPMEGGYQEGYNIEERKYNPAIVCPLGKTVVIGGYRDFKETTAPLVGTPIFRNVPILGWFFAKDSESVEDVKIMMLVSVREVRPDEPEVQTAKLPYDECKNLTTEVQISNEDRLEARKCWSGWLYWMNWFMP